MLPLSFTFILTILRENQISMPKVKPNAVTDSFRLPLQF